jgi:hypothetical protein
MIFTALDYGKGVGIVYDTAQWSKVDITSDDFSLEKGINIPHVKPKYTK